MQVTTRSQVTRETTIQWPICQEGFGPMHMTVKNGVTGGLRLTAYLRRAMQRPYLKKLKTGVLTTVLLKVNNAEGQKKRWYWVH